jgi:predicted CxxxxCH...CXXCH cytochrome family protein
LYDQTSTTGTQDCTNIYCHSSAPADGGINAPSYATADWGSAASGACGTCHSQTDPATGAHTAHVNDGSVMSNKACSDCHSGNTHVDQNVDVNVSSWGGSAAYSGTAAPRDGYGSCTNLSCHSDGKSSPTYQTIAWGDSISGCVSCHEGASAGTALSGAHEAHTVSATATIGKTLGCVDCHGATVSNNTTISTPAQHIDGGVDVISCATNLCHSDGNIGNVTYNVPTFATDIYDCTTCHGNGTDQSYPSYADGGAGTADSNSHNAHVGSSLVSCEECHTDTSLTGNAIDGATPLQHVDGGIDVVFKQTGSYSGELDNTDTCSTTYCHGAGTPQWGDAGSLDCSSCHSANSSLADSHGVHYNIGTLATGISTVNNSTTLKYVFECGTCHNSISHAGGEEVSGIQAAEVSLFGSGTYTANSATFGVDNGFKYTAGTCNTNDCHNDGQGGVPNYNGAVLQWSVTTLPADCTGCHNSNVAAVGNEMATGAHAAHMNDGSIMDDKSCQTCHDATMDASDTAIADKSVHVNQVVNVAILGTYGGSFAGGNCSNVYCHSDGKATPNYASAKDWTTPIGDCVSCHGGANGSNGGDGTSTTALTDSHTVHTGTFSYTCDDCHVQTASNNTTIDTATNHVNQAIDVAVAAANGGTGSIGGDFSGGSCATTLCHGSTTPTWATGGTTGNCSICHGMEANPADGRDTAGNTANTDAQVGAHVAHLNATKGYTDPITCDECHLTTVTNQTAAGTYVAKVNAVGHIDTGGAAELTFGTVANYNSATPGYSGAPGGTCATTYCHDGAIIGKGWSGTLNVPDWNTPYFTGTKENDCAFCHGYPPAGSHTPSTNCNSCHSNTVAVTNDGFTDPSLHINGTVEFDGGDNCSDCHTTPSGDHSDHTDYAIFLAGKTVSGGDYGKVAGSGTYGYGWYDTDYNSSGLPLFGCGNCHPAAEGVSHPLNGTNVDLDGSDELASLPDPHPKRSTGASANYTSNRCYNTYCHSDGAGTFDATPPAWGTDTIECDGCHGNSPTTNAHSLHEVAIHYEALLDDDRVGLMAKGTDDIGAADGEGGNYGAGAAHGNTATSTPINCKTCHKNTVQDTANAGNTTCAGCHSDTDSIATGNELARIASDSFVHINGQVDISFADMSTFKSRAQLRNDITAVDEVDGSWARYNSAGLDNTAYKQGTSYDLAKNAVPVYNSADMTCSTVYCHNSIKTPTWNSASNNCMSCHTKLPQ